jgi:8-oxo-dGTP pyrophosphatase MutT (NUDIX family)
VFETHPAAVVVPIVNRREELLLLESPLRPGWWEPVNGAVEKEETLIEAALREVREEVGADLRVRPLGVVSRVHLRLRRPSNAHDQRYLPDGVPRWCPAARRRHARERVQWATLDEIEDQSLCLVPPLDQAWLRRRTLELFRLWEPATDAPLQPGLTESGWNKHENAH